MIWRLLRFLTFLAAVSDSPVPEEQQKLNLPRLVLYYQTTHDATGHPVSLLPLITEKGIALTHLIVSSFHVQENGDIHLNDKLPSSAAFQTLWNETAVLQNAGVKVMGMLGGAAAGSFTRSTLDGNQATFDKYYGQLRDVITARKLQGLDIDVEQPMSQSGITRLVNQLHSDIGPDFIITLAPVASALQGRGNLSGFNYATLEADTNSTVSFYNAQFYNRFGSMATAADYESIVSRGWRPSKVVAGQLTMPMGGSGYIPPSRLNVTVISLMHQYGQVGGIMGWEYYNAKPGGTSKPWEWAQIMTSILRPNLVPTLSITRVLAEHLSKTYKLSMLLRGSLGNAQPPKVDYFAMVNA